MAGLSCTDRSLSRIVEGRGIRSRLIVAGRELFLTNVSGVKAERRKIGRITPSLRRNIRVLLYCVNQSTSFSEAALGARGLKVQGIKEITAPASSSFSFLFFFNSISTISLAREQKYASASDLLGRARSVQGLKIAWDSDTLRANEDSCLFRKWRLIYLACARVSSRRAIARAAARRRRRKLVFLLNE